MAASGESCPGPTSHFPLWPDLAWYGSGQTSHFLAAAQPRIVLLQPVLTFSSSCSISLFGTSDPTSHVPAPDLALSGSGPTSHFPALARPPICGVLLPDLTFFSSPISHCPDPARPRIVRLRPDLTFSVSGPTWLCPAPGRPQIFRLLSDLA